MLSTAIIAATLAIPLRKTGLAADADLKDAIIIQWGAVMGWCFGFRQGSSAKDTTIATMAAKQEGNDRRRPDLHYRFSGSQSRAR